MPFLIIIGIVVVVAVIVCVYKIYCWHDEAKKYYELCREFYELKRELSEARSKIKTLEEEMEEAIEVKSREIAKNMEKLHDLARFYSEEDMYAFRRYFQSPSFDDYLNSIRSDRFIKTFDEYMEVLPGISVTAQVTSASEEDVFYTVTLDSCTCPDFKSRENPCKHMLFLAMRIGTLMYKKEDRDKLYKEIYSNLKTLKARESAVEKAENKLSRQAASLKAKKKKQKT